mgnify:CR=1 FL=1
MNSELNINKNKFLKILLVSCGFISVGLGVLGIFLPVLPTTPFLLLAATCFSRSSERFYKWLFSNKVFGKYLNDYKNKKGLPVKIKIYTISLLWISILYTVIFIIPLMFVKLLLLVIAIVVTIHIILVKNKKIVK